MNADSQDFKYSNLTEKIIELFYKVYNKLGYGFLEKIYERAMIYELKKAKIGAFSQVPIRVYYDEEVLGEYFADIVVENKIIVEVKAIQKIAKEHESQLLNYLKATDKEVGLILNFGPQAQIKRKAFSNIRKSALISVNQRAINE